MARQQVIDAVTKCIEPVIENLNYELVDVEFVQEGGDFYLRIYVDQEEGITFEDCKKVSRAVEPVLDEKDPISSQYMLEISSAGLDRIIKKDKDFKKFADEIVDVKLYKAQSLGTLGKKKQFQAQLHEKTKNDNDQEIVSFFTEEGEKIEVLFENINSVRLAILF
ncbi:MAG: hypothetical protein ATN36_05960 [Epulopiscium sp. Nele67-Bin005]|nr:MAG: hypothetical protein ATN36_05960 [Epulopiscium sp. Nele67-Bin005]